VSGTRRSSLATGSSSLATFVQVVPRLPTLLRRLEPTWHMASLAALDEKFLESHGIRGLIWDVDGTLTGDRGQLLAETEPSFRALLSRPGLKHVVVSNSGEERFRQLGDIFPTVPLVRAYALGESVLYRRRLGRADSWSEVELEQRLSEGARMIRKPSAELVDYAIRELECSKDEAVMIGDQYFTDVAGANLAGVRSIKLPTLAKETFRFGVRLSHGLEKLTYVALYGRPRWL
jgi:HAD superfamily phosphatase (TIGR01668 family)